MWKKNKDLNQKISIWWTNLIHFKIVASLNYTTPHVLKSVTNNLLWDVWLTSIGLTLLLICCFFVLNQLSWGFGEILHVHINKHHKSYSHTISNRLNRYSESYHTPSIENRIESCFTKRCTNLRVSMLNQIVRACSNSNRLVTGRTGVMLIFSSHPYPPYALWTPLIYVK